MRTTRLTKRTSPRTGRVPTRANLHDLFNALIFLRFPKAKAKLNSCSQRQLQADGVGPVRGPLRDAATLVDENAYCLSAIEWTSLSH